MRRSSPLELFIVILIAIFGIVGWRLYGGPHPVAGIGHAQNAPSRLYASLTIQYTHPPIFEERYYMQDLDGVSTFDYSIRGYNCRLVTIKAPTGRIYDVSFFFGGLDEDGIWQLTNAPLLPHAAATYTVYVKQVADFKQGDRTVVFQDPQYWTTHSPREVQLDVSKGGADNVLRLQASSPDPRYQKIVEDFRNFGPDEFRRNVALAQDRAKENACR
ncbi:MAG TPA: hypothetical protein VN936_01195 [Candidatus Acidoferrum sp.]|nr:hypothetical protein [Candidatus Acidoferrum sp.]